MDDYIVAENPNKPQAAQSGLRQWAIDHEERPSFLVLYIAAAVVLSLIISLFWLVVVVALHLLFEIMRHKAHERNRVIGEAFWEVKLDAALILIALALAVYIHAVFGVLGLSTAARAAGASARFVVLQRAIRGVLLSIDDALLVVRGAAKQLGGRAASRQAAPGTANGAADEADDESEAHRGEEETPDAQQAPSWRQRWSALDWTTVGIAVASLALIAAAPLLTQHTYATAFHEIGAELHPWPMDSPLQGWLNDLGAWIRA